MPHRTIDRNARLADRLNAIDAASALWFRGMPAIFALVLVLVLLISHGGAG